VKRRYISTRQYGVISQKTLTFTVTAVELGNLSDCFIFPFFIYFFPTFSCFLFIMFPFYSYVSFRVSYIVCLFPSSLVFLFRHSISVSFAPSPLRLLFTYTHVLSCMLISHKQLPANGTCCVCVCVWWHCFLTVHTIRHLCHCCCERGRAWDWKHI